MPTSFVAAAALPLVVDPLIGGAFDALAPTSNDVDIAPDVAYDADNGVYLVVCERIWSLLDHDIHAQRVDASGALVGNRIFLENTGAFDSRHCRVANVSTTDSFVVVWHETGAQDIKARIVDAATGALNPAGDLLVAAGADVEITPDVGGESSFEDDAIVTWVNATTGELMAAQVQTNSENVIDRTTLFASAAQPPGDPQISNGNGETGYHMVTYTRDFGTDRDVYAVLIDRNITIRSDQLSLESTLSLADEKDVAVDGDGRTWVTAWATEEPGTPGSYDIVCRSYTLDPNGAPLNGARPLSSKIPVTTNTNDDEYATAVIWTGGSTLIAWSDVDGAVTNTYLRSFDPLSCELCETTGIQQISVGLNSGDDIRLRGCSKASAGVLGSSEALLVWENLPTTTGNGDDVYRSNDGGQTWTLRGAVNEPRDQWWYNNCIWVDPNNANRVVVGAISVWRSTDGAATWTEVGDWDATSPHADVHAVVAHPGFNGSSNKQVMLATDGGIYRTMNIDTASNTTGATGWTPRNQGLRVAQFYEADGTANLLLAGGLQDNGTVSIQGNTSQAANRYVGGDGTPIHISPNNSNFIYGAYQRCWPHRSTDGGGTGDAIVSGLSTSEYGNQPSGNPRPPFRTPLTLANSDPNYLYMGSFSVWRCANATATTPTWSAIRAPLPPPTDGAWAASAIASSPTDEDVVWVSYWNEESTTARLSVSFNATSANPTWADLSMNSFPAGRIITNLEVDNANPFRCMLCFGGFAADGLWRTTFFLSQTDADLSGDGVTALPEAPVYSVAQHPTLSDVLYAATEVGVFTSADGGQTWAPDNGGPLDVACFDIRFANNSETLVLATHGRGIWTTEVFVPQANAFGAGCAGTFGTPQLSATSPRVGEDCVTTTTDCYPGGSLWLVQGYSDSDWLGLPLPLTAFGAPGCDLLVRPDIVRDGFADAAGVATVTVPIPPLMALAGQRIYLQSWAADVVNSFGRVGSQGIELVVGY